jgi:hypothetical protein
VRKTRSFGRLVDVHDFLTKLADYDEERRRVEAALSRPSPT